jgi:hypothetical protein
VIGPVQLLVVGFDDPTFTGEVLAEFARLRDAGVVRLVDVLVVSRDDDGSFRTIVPPHPAAADLGGIVTDFLVARDDAPDDATDSTGTATDREDEAGSWSLEAAVPSGTTAAVALIEHTWAGPVVQALARTGGRPLDETWLPPDDRRLLALLENRSAVPDTR